MMGRAEGFDPVTGNRGSGAEDVGAEGSVVVVVGNDVVVSIGMKAGTPTFGVGAAVVDEDDD